MSQPTTHEPRDMTPETHGNAICIGMADFTTARLVRQIDHRVMAINALTALTVQGAKIPIHFETDRETIEIAFGSLALDDLIQAKVMHIQDTLTLEKLEVSEAYTDSVKQRADLATLSGPTGMQFDEAGNLAP